MTNVKDHNNPTEQELRALCAPAKKISCAELWPNGRLLYYEGADDGPERAYFEKWCADKNIEIWKRERPEWCDTFEVPAEHLDELYDSAKIVFGS